MDNGQPLSEEVQRFRNPTLWIIFVGAFSVVLILCGYVAVLGPLSRIPWSDMSIWMKLNILIGGLGIVLFSGVVGLFAQATLITQVRQDGLYVRWYPLHFSFQKIPLEDVERVTPTTCRPARDYPGWGIRYGRSGKAYNIHGDRGVKLEYPNGRHVLIGSQKPEELAAAIEPLIKAASIDAGKDSNNQSTD